MVGNKRILIYQIVGSPSTRVAREISNGFENLGEEASFREAGEKRKVLQPRKPNKQKYRSNNTWVHTGAFEVIPKWGGIDIH